MEKWQCYVSVNILLSYWSIVSHTTISLVGKMQFPHRMADLAPAGCATVLANRGILLKSAQLHYANILDNTNISVGLTSHLH